MSQIIVRRALENHLRALLPPMPIAFENVMFTPSPGISYQRINLLPNTPDNSIQGQATYFERGLLQITVCVMYGSGPSAVEAQAQAIRQHYKRGTSLLDEGLTTLITDTPRVATGYKDGDRWCVPISIPYQCQIST